MAPSGHDWLTIVSPHFRVHHTAPLETYARALTQAFERSLPELEKRLNWKAPAAIDVVVMDPSDYANGLAMSFPSTRIELFAAPFNSDSPLAYYHDWADELATHELTHIVANDTALGFYKTLRSVFGSWVKPNGLQPLWLSEGLAVYQETSLTAGGRGRSPLLEALLREAVLRDRLDAPGYTSLDRLNDGVPWWPAGNTPYLLGYTIQALSSGEDPNLPGKISYENGGTIIFAPNRVVRSLTGRDWAEVWSGATTKLRERYQGPVGQKASCPLTESGRHTGGHVVSFDGWIYFSEESWDRGYHLARMRVDSPCGGGVVERLARKPYSGPTQVAASPSGGKVAYAALDLGYETEFSDIYLWTERRGIERLTKDERARDPAFLSEEALLFVRANEDTSQSIVQRELRDGTETVLFSCRPLERISGLAAAGGRIVFALHGNGGHEKIHELRGGEAKALVPIQNQSREFERNPTLHDGFLYFAAAYGNGPQEIFRWKEGGAPERMAAGELGYLDRPIVLPGGKAMVVQAYDGKGLDIARWDLPEEPLGEPVQPADGDDLHDFLTGEKPPAAPASDIPLPPSVPYTIGDSGTSLWPKYWFPEVSFAQDGILAGASTSGNDALDYHRYYALAQYDSRASFPQYLAYYRNRAYATNFHLQASQSNSYFLTTRTSNRNASYSAEAIFPLWDFSLSFGAAYRDIVLFGSRSQRMLAFQYMKIDRSGRTPSAIAPNWGAALENFTAVYPNSRNEETFVELRPQLHGYLRGLHPSHSVSLGLAAGITTNRFLASNYFQGGGPTPLSPSAYVVRGYGSDTLFGQRVAVANLAYTLPLAHVHHGIGTQPIFLDTLGLRFSGDVGSANYMAVYSGDSFQRYERDDLGKRLIYGWGVDLVTQGSLLYHVPAEVTVGFHHGTERRYGGGDIFYLAFSLGLDRVAFRKPAVSTLPR